MNSSTGVREPNLNRSLIRARRLELGLTLQQVGAELGFSMFVWRRYEAGELGAGLTLGQLDRLATVLGLPRTALLAENADREGPHTNASNEPSVELLARLGALLLSAGRSVDPATAARLLEATTDEVDCAVTQLREHLAGTGIVLSCNAAGVTLVPGPGSLTDGAVRDGLRDSDTRGALTSPAARILHQAARGEMPRQLKLRDRAHLALLLRAHMLAPPDTVHGGLDYLELHPDARFSLALDDGIEIVAAQATVHAVPNRKTLDLSAEHAGLSADLVEEA